MSDVAWKDYQRPRYEPLRGMTRLVDRIEFFWFEYLRKLKGISKRLLMQTCGCAYSTYWAWRWRGWVPLWAIKRARRAKLAKTPHVDIVHFNTLNWRHKELLRGQRYHISVKEGEIRKARKAAFMFANRRGYTIATNLTRGRKSLYLTITRV